jgi:hypothetical protein
MVFQWLLAAVTNDEDMLDELQDAIAEQSCRSCVAAVTRALAQLADHLSVKLRGRDGAAHDAERLLARLQLGRHAGLRGTQLEPE